MMRVIAYIVLSIALIAGFIGAITAYLPRLDQAAASTEPLHTNAPAGARTNEKGERAPIVEPRTELTAEVVAELESAGVERVRVREFSFGRWTGWWLYLLSAVGLVGAGLFLRRQAQMVEPAPSVTAMPSDPPAILAEMRRLVHEILRVLPAEPLEYHAGIPAHGRAPFAATVIEHVGEIQKTLMPAFIDARPQLVAAFGMAGYAHLMDTYAAAERALNRAWSAAADGDEIEALASLERARALLEASMQRLPKTAF